MKKYIVIILFIVSDRSLGQNLSNIQSTQNNARFEHRIDSLDNKVAQIEEFKKQQEELVRQTTQTIVNQNSVIGSFGTIYTILTILITIVSIGLPIMMYQFGIKPSKNALKELEINLDKRVEDYLKETRSNQIKQSIDNLKGNNIELKNQAISFLSLTAHSGFSDQQLFDFYRLIKSGQLNDIHTSTISFLLGSKNNNYADEIFRDKEMLNNIYIKNNALQYIFSRKFENFIETLKYFLDKSDNKSTEFFSLLGNLITYNSQSAIDFFNCQVLIDYLPNEALTKMKQDMTFYISHYKIDEEQYKKTYLFKKLQNDPA